MLNYTDMTQNTYVPSWTVIEIMTKLKLWTSFWSTNESCQLVNFIYTARGFGANSADARLKCISLHMSGRQVGSQQAG